MKYASLVAAAALILLADAVALVHAARNRSGMPEADLILTNRELNYHPDPDDSGVALHLVWVSPTTWLGRAKLEALGFDCSVAPSDPKAGGFYSRQIPRAGFVAMEYDGPAWQAWLEELRKQTAQPDAIDHSRFTSRLVLIDAARDAVALRARHPDRIRVLIVPAAFRISFVANPASFTGFLQEIPSVIHVPRPLSDGLRSGPFDRVHLRYGSLLEPWVTGVELGKQ